MPRRRRKRQSWRHPKGTLRLGGPFVRFAAKTELNGTRLHSLQQAAIRMATPLALVVASVALIVADSVRMVTFLALIVRSNSNHFNRRIS